MYLQGSVRSGRGGNICVHDAEDDDDDAVGMTSMTTKAPDASTAELWLHKQVCNLQASVSYLVKLGWQPSSQSCYENENNPRTWLKVST